MCLIRNESATPARCGIVTLFLSFAATVVLACIVLGSAPVRAAELVMFEQDACEWCQRWHEEIGPIYPKTDEGRRAPLRTVDIHAPLPADLDEIVPGPYTPTFVLIEDGRELGRIRGYPGEDFFWALLAQLIERLDETPRNAAANTVKAGVFR